jgi:hypothetical protein
MDLTQSKLSKNEWETIEVPVSENEKKILAMIVKGYDDLNIHTNDTQSMYSFIKVEQTPEIEDFLYKKHFQEQVDTIIKKYCKDNPISKFTSKPLFSGGELKTMKSADSIRLQNLENNIQQNKQVIFEFLLLDLTKEMVSQVAKRKQKYAFYLYTILQLK